MNIFGGNPAIVNPRTRGDTSTLPMQLQITTSRLSAISKLAIGLFLAVLGYDNIGSFSNWVFRSSSFSFFVLGPCTLPGHASLRSLVDAGMASLAVSDKSGLKPAGRHCQRKNFYLPKRKFGI